MELRRLPFAGGWVGLATDGSVAAVEHPVGGRALLLNEHAPGPEQLMHSAARRWGKGFLIADGFGYRFDAPATLSWLHDGVRLRYDCGPLQLHVQRRVTDEWSESYELQNPTGQAVTVGSLALSTPWRDVYQSSHDSLTNAVHAHIWTGGADSWVWAMPMDGSTPGLGLRLTEGELWAYSVESRDHLTGSNVRGHLYLHATDHARSPHTLGGQPELVLPPGGRYRLGWSLRWHPSLADFHAGRTPLVELPRVAGEVGEELELRLAPGAATDVELPLTSTEPGLRYVDVRSGDGRRARVACLFHQPLRRLAERRAEFLLDRQRPRELSDSRRFAFVPYDNDARLTVLGGTWNDWSDGRERIGSALLLQELLRRGWGDQSRLTEALRGYQAFVTEHVVRPDGTVLDFRADQETVRLYNFPWFARFLLDAGDLDLAHRIMTRFYALGGEHFLAFELGGVVGDIAGRLVAEGAQAEAGALTERLIQQAERYLGYGTELPPHEVNYEQSMVAPLLDLLLAAHRLAPDRVPADELLRRLPWLTAFAADQPDPRMRAMPIRHWDGYWFGRLRLWGDVFPHYWSILSAGVFLAWPDGLLPAAETAALQAQGRTILRGNLTAFGPDGSATCAFVYPSCVNGQPAHVADPLANDQDWALVYALRHGLEAPP